MPGTPRPHLGAIVIWKAKYPAIVIRVHDDTWVDLCVFDKDNRCISNAEFGVSWSWPVVPPATIPPSPFPSPYEAFFP